MIDVPSEGVVTDILDQAGPAPALLDVSETCQPRSFWRGVTISDRARFGAVLESRRKALGQSLRGLERATGLSWPTLKNLETLKRYPCSRQTSALAVLRALAVPPALVADSTRPECPALPLCPAIRAGVCLCREDFDRLAGWPLRLLAREALRATLRTTNVAEAARRAGVSRRTIYNWFPELTHAEEVLP